MEKTKEYFDNNVEGFSGSRNAIWSELEELKKYIKNGERVLDLGCGNGRLFELFRGKNIEYTGVDFSEKLIEKAREKYGEHFQVADILSLPCTQKINKTIDGNKNSVGCQGLPLLNNSFDSVWSIAVLHHIPSKELRLKALEEVRRVLKPGGKVIMTCWYLFRPFFCKDILISPKKLKIQRYYHAFTRRELKKLFEKAGFKIEELKYLKRNNKKTNILVVAVKS